MFEYRLMYSRPRIAVAELYHFCQAARTGTLSEPAYLVDNASRSRWTFTSSNPKDLRLRLMCDLRVSPQRRGVVLIPFIQATLVIPHLESRQVHLTLFRILVKNGGGKASEIAKRLAVNETTTIAWSDFGLAGIQSLKSLFLEFAGENETIRNLVMNRGPTIFELNPDPRPHRDRRDQVFITESAQPAVFENWRRQVEDYRNRLTPRKDDI